MLSLDHISLWDKIMDNKENVIIGLCILKKILALLIKLVLWTQLSFSICFNFGGLNAKKLVPSNWGSYIKEVFCDSFEDVELSVCHPSLGKSRASQLVKWMEKSQNQWFLAQFILKFVTLQNLMPKHFWFQADFSHWSLVIYFFATSPIKRKLMKLMKNRWETTNSKPPWGIIMIGQSETGNSSQIIFITLLSRRCTLLLCHLLASAKCAYMQEQNHVPCPTGHLLTFLHLILMCRVTYWA
jgi:hypothetical protein